MLLSYLRQQVYPQPMMFTKGKNLFRRALTSKAQSLYCVVKDSTPSHPQTVCSCYGNNCHRNNIFQHRGQSQLSFARSMYRAQLGQYNRHQRLGRMPNNPTRVTVFLRSFSSESDASEKTSNPIDLHEEDPFEDVVKELDAEGSSQRVSRKGKSLADSLKDSMKSVGRLVPDKIVNLLDEDGESLGSLHRTEAIKRSQQAGLKLVLVDPKSQPYPTYRLMTGQQLHREQMLLNEKLKAKSAPTQVKEARLSGNIAKHDLEIKRRHVYDWFKEGGANVHVKVTVMGAGKRQKPVTKEQQMSVINQLMSGLEERVTFVSKPRDIGKDGMNLTVILRPMSAKEKATLIKQKNKEESLKQQGDDGEEDSGDGKNDR